MSLCVIAEVTMATSLIWYFKINNNPKRENFILLLFIPSLELPSKWKYKSYITNIIKNMQAINQQRKYQILGIPVKTNFCGNVFPLQCHFSVDKKSNLHNRYFSKLTFVALHFVAVFFNSTNNKTQWKGWRFRHGCKIKWYSFIAF